MNLVQRRLDDINNPLLKNANGINNIGLLNGKMGISIYFFHLAKVTESNEHQMFAENLIESIYREINSGIFIPDFENGLAGVGWGIEYCDQQGHIDSDTDLILSEIDNRLYKFLVGNQKLSLGVNQGVIGYILYCLVRFERTETSNDRSNNYVFKRLLIELVNRIGECVEDRAFISEEPLLFDITWDLPICLIVLAEVRKLGIYDSKIDRVLEHLSPLVLSLCPRLHSHQIFLLLGMEVVHKQVQLPNWSRHIEHLKQKFLIPELLKQDFKDQHLYWLDGISGVSLLARLYYQLVQDDRFIFRNNDLIEKIGKSTYWEELKQDEFKQKNLGLLYGISGIGLELLQLLKDQKENSIFNCISK